MTIKSTMVLLGTVLALGLAFRSPARAGDTTPTPAAPGKAVAPAQVSITGEEALKSSVIQWQPLGQVLALAAGEYNPVFTTTMTCPYKSCTFGFEDIIQIAPTSTNPWAICAEVNGTRNLCPYQGNGLSNDYSVGTSLQSFGPVPRGTYTLTVLVYVTSPTGMTNSEAIYRLYTP
jgi:hypothetical protein